MKPKELYQKYEHYILYVFFGVLTTLVNVVVYWIVAHPLGVATVPSSVVAWIAAVLFAYLTNRRWVFGSDADSAGMILKEMLFFFGCRLSTGIIDWTIMYVFVDLLHFNDILIKILANVVVMVLNYIASKLLIFRKR